MRLINCLAAVVVLGGLNVDLHAADAPATPAPPAPAAMPEKPEPKYPDFNLVTKDMVAQNGMLTLYRYKADNEMKDQTKILAVVPRSLIGQDVLLAMAISRGQYTGLMQDDYLVRFEMLGKNVVLSVPDERYVRTPGQPVTDSVTRTYLPAFLAAMPIETMTPGGDPVIDLSAFVMGHSVQLPVSQGLQPRRDLSKYSKVKVFPENVLIDVDMAMSNQYGVGQSVGVSYAFRKLPAGNGYQPRLADERVGYFTTVRQDWNAKHTDRENLVRYVNRWQLEKKDPSLELSPPKKPIVFIVEKTVPLQWRKYIAAGILEWNKAFEKVGFQDAVVVQQQTDDNEYADIDPEDARYNFFRWIVTGTPFAMGPSRADPRTGQLLDANIVFDDSMLRWYLMDFDLYSPAAVSSIVGPELGEFLKQNPSFLPAGQKLEPTAASNDSWMKGMGTQPGVAVGTSTAELLHENGVHGDQQNAQCNYADGLKHQLAIAQLALIATADGKKIPEKFVGEAIKEVVSHEVGHTLGLRHNFKASSWLTMDEIKKRRDNTDEPLVASVMDYNPLLFFPGDDPEKIRHFVTPTIGPYDEWAIEYGYKIAASGDPDEKTLLAHIAEKNTKREYAYATDEDTVGASSPDPLVNRFDMGDDPGAWAKSRIQLIDGLLKDVKKWAVKKDEPNYYLRGIVQTLEFDKAVNVMFVSRVVGGQNFTRNRPGDPDARPAFTLLDPKQQRDALKLLGETVFKDDFYSVSPSLLNDLGPSRWMDWASSPALRVDYPVHQMVSAMQAYTLLNLVSPQVMQRVYDAEMKSTSDDKFTAAELITGVRSVIWGDVSLPEGKKFSDSKPMIASTRRNLQKQWLSYMVASVDAKSGTLMSPDLQSMVAFSLRELSEQIGTVLDQGKSGDGASRIDFATRAHLSESKSEIDRVINAPHMLPQPGGMIIMINGEAEKK